MSTPVLDDRTFESATTPTPEEELATKAHFEAKGYEVEVEPEDGAVVPPAGDTTPEVVPPSAAQPESAAVVDDPEIDPESRAEWQAATNDGQKLGRLAKKTKKINELTATVTEKDARLSEKEARIQELERRLAERPASSSSPALAPTPAVPEPAKPEAPAPIKAKEFDKAEPTEPTLEQFAGEDDPHAAFAAAGIKYAKDLRAYDREKQAFDTAEANRVAAENRQQNEQFAQKTEKQTFIQTRFNDALREYPDLVQKTDGIPWPSTARYLLTEIVPNGFKLGYELAKPENREILDELIAKLPESRDPNVCLQQVQFIGPQALAVAEYRLKNRIAPPPAAAAPPVVAAPPSPAPIAPSNQPPRREEASPVPVRGHAAPALKPEDVNPMDSDARRALRGLPSAAASVPKSRVQ